MGFLPVMDDCPVLFVKMDGSRVNAQETPGFLSRKPFLIFSPLPGAWRYSVGFYGFMHNHLYPQHFQRISFFFKRCVFIAPAHHIEEFQKIRNPLLVRAGCLCYVSYPKFFFKAGKLFFLLAYILRYERVHVASFGMFLPL